MLRSSLLDKEKIETILNIFASKCLERNIAGPINIYVVGGASIVMKFKFRAPTIDIDAYFKKTKDLEDIIKEISEEQHIAKDWMNDEFVNTPSFSSKIIEVAKLYSIYQNLVYFYILDPEYMIAMKDKQ